MMHVIVWELRRRRSAIMWWALGTVLITAGIIALFPSISDQAAQLNKVINALPPGLRQLKSGGTSSVNVADPAAFLNSQLFYATLPIIWIILAITRGGSVLGRDEQTRTLELLLARPISRTKLLAAKAISFFMEFAIVALSALVTVLLLAPVFDLSIGAERLTLATIYTALFSLSFGLIALALTAASKLTHRSATAVAVVVGFGGYMITSLSGLTDWLEIPAKFAPFHYFKPDAILNGQAVVGLDIYLVGVFVLTAAVAYIGFARRDIS